MITRLIDQKETNNGVDRSKELKTTEEEKI